jgi:superfamily I DNA and/or RNA helicase
VQKVEWSEGETDGLFSAPAEARAIIDILDEILPVRDQACEVQILSPYNDQLALIKTEIENAKRRGRLSHMFDPPFDLRQGKRMGATVDEFQGSESDIVVVSLVRNNGLVPWKSIGFLKEPNRMNVLLSRARHKLIIVGSWDFFKSRCNEATSSDVEYYYLARMMSVMEDASRACTLAVVK